MFLHFVFGIPDFDTDMEKVCLLPQPHLRIFNNFLKLSIKILTIYTFYTSKWLIFTLKLTKFTLFHHFKHKRGLYWKQPFCSIHWGKFHNYYKISTTLGTLGPAFFHVCFDTNFYCFISNENNFWRKHWKVNMIFLKILWLIFYKCDTVFWLVGVMSVEPVSVLVYGWVGLGGVQRVQRHGE